jgi:hypothetical protein
MRRLASPRAPAASPRNGRGRLAPLFVFSLLVAPDAMAYLDPGTGSILLQGLIATFAATATWFSLNWRRVKSWMTSLFARFSGGLASKGRARR